MSKSNTYETQILALLLNATPIANVADNAASAPLTQLFIAWHTADPGEGGTQATNEATFTGITRTAIARNNGAPAWTISSPGGVGTAQNTSPITGPTYTAGAGVAQTLTFFSVGAASSGASEIFYSGLLANGGIIMNPGETIDIAANAITETED
jgi:hypothetical protein